MSYHIYIINTLSDFNLHFPKLEESALRNETPRTYEVGFDLEYICKGNNPSFIHAQKWCLNTGNNLAACLIQIASKGVCLVVSLVRLGPLLPKKLLKLIKNDNWVKYGVGVENDLSILSSNYSLGHCAGGLDLKNMALLHNHSSPSLKTLSEDYLGIKLSKNKSVVDWSQSLSHKQLDYAATDAIVSYELGKHLLRFKMNSKKTLVLEKVFENGSKTPTLEMTKINTNVDSISKLKEYADKFNLDEPKYTFKKHPNGSFEVVCTFKGHQTSFVASNKKIAKNGAAAGLWNLIFPDQELSEPTDTLDINYIGKIQEYAQKQKYIMPVYSEDLSGDEKVVKCTFLNFVGIGRGHNKKEAKVKAAKIVYKKILP